jgi:hypothetical protein
MTDLQSEFRELSMDVPGIHHPLNTSRTKYMTLLGLVLL